jgi:uncharacterized protein (DUF952 family)
MIFHVTTQNNWEDALKNGFYAAPSWHSEGFIHMSMKHQVQGVLERYYQGMKNLVLLHIDESKLKAELKYELSPSVNQEFPHLFGTLNVDAVVEVEPL